MHYLSGMSASAGCVVRFFTRNDRGWKHLFYREIRQGATLEEATAWAFHTIRKTRPDVRAQILSIEVQDLNGVAAVVAPPVEPERGRAKSRGR